MPIQLNSWGPWGQCNFHDSIFSLPRGMYHAKLYVWTVWTGICFQLHKSFYLLHCCQSPTTWLMPLALLMQYLAQISATTIWKNKLERFPGNVSVSMQRLTCLVPWWEESMALWQYTDRMGSLSCTPSQTLNFFSWNFLSSSDQDRVIDPASQNCNISGFFLQLLFGSKSLSAKKEWKEK